MYSTTSQLLGGPLMTQDSGTSGSPQLPENVLVNVDRKQAGSEILTLSTSMFAMLACMVGVFAGFAVWASSLNLTGEVEPWDSEFYLVTLILGISLGALVTRDPAWTAIWYGIGLWVGQVLAIAFVPHIAIQGWFNLGVITTGIGSVQGIVGVYLAWFSRWLLHLWLLRS